MSKIISEQKQQIVQFHAVFIHNVVMACLNRELLPQLEQMLQMSSSQGWDTLVSAIRQIVNGKRDLSLLAGLDDEDATIVEAILLGIQDPATLPDPDAKPDPTLAAPGLASMIDAAGKGNPEALHMLANMAEQMMKAGGDMALLGGRMRRLVNGERDTNQLIAGMGPLGRELMISLLDELARLRLQ